jgi:hypothetical protein
MDEELGDTERVSQCRCARDERREGPAGRVCAFASTAAEMLRRRG